MPTSVQSLGGKKTYFLCEFHGANSSKKIATILVFPKHLYSSYEFHMGYLVNGRKVWKESFFSMSVFHGFSVNWCQWLQRRNCFHLLNSNAYTEKRKAQGPSVGLYEEQGFIFFIYTAQSAIRYCIA